VECTSGGADLKSQRCTAKRHGGIRKNTVKVNFGVRKKGVLLRRLSQGTEKAPVTDQTISQGGSARKIGTGRRRVENLRDNSKKTDGVGVSENAETKGHWWNQTRHYGIITDVLHRKREPAGITGQNSSPPKQGVTGGKKSHCAGSEG